jgi:hypothetical protein
MQHSDAKIEYTRQHLQRLGCTEDQIEKHLRVLKHNEKAAAERQHTKAIRQQRERSLNHYREIEADFTVLGSGEYSTICLRGHRHTGRRNTTGICKQCAAQRHSERTPRVRLSKAHGKPVRVRLGQP